MSVTEKIVAIQAENISLPMTATNPHFKSKYIPLDKLTEKILPVLRKHDLAWVTQPTHIEGEPALYYKLTHTAATSKNTESIIGVMPLALEKQSPQALGSAITYARRYALMTVLGLVGEVDDDGNSTSERPASPTIPMDRASKILKSAVKAKLATLDSDRSSYPVFTPTLVAKLSSLGVSKIGALSVDQAEELESWLEKEINDKR